MNYSVLHYKGNSHDGGQPPQKRLGILGRVSGNEDPPANGAALRLGQLRHIQAVPAAPSPLRQPKPVQHPVFALVPLAVLRLISLLPIARSAALFVRGTSRRPPRRNGARHFPLSSTQRRRRAASPSRTARSSRGRSKPPSGGRPVSSRHILALPQSQPSILSRRFFARFFTRTMRI